MDKTVLLETLRKYYGFSSFRPLQEEIVEMLLSGKDALVLMPTGGGKSVCYQLPALLQEGMAVVVSPLISLMKDQVEALRSNGVSAAFLNSSLSDLEQRGIIEQALNNELKLLYVSPERLMTPAFMGLLKQLPVSLFAVDEAHCISAWGHDFRPEYAQLSVLKAQFPKVPMVALTATADRATRQDIVNQLQLNSPGSFLASFDRPNIELQVLPARNRMDYIRSFVGERPSQPGIIYCLSRKSTEDVAAGLQRIDVRARAYHAGMGSEDRAAVQEAFIKDDITVVCATVAFGMGIDKANVRWVIHYNMPKNLESYYQEIGRCGRDSLPAKAILFYSYRDVMVLREMLGKNAQPEVQLAKLEQMQQYAEARICRRKILLHYFSEELNKNCGNCDVCRQPPQAFDGTLPAQKVLSAVARTQQKVGMTLAIDILRGSRKQEIIEKGYDRIKTYGVGADMSYFEWQQVIYQLVQLGFLEIAYDENMALKLTDASQEVLFKGKKVPLVKMPSNREKAAKAMEKPKSQKQQIKEGLFEKLRVLRKQLADQQGVPPYVVFSDATLMQMVEKKPVSDAAMQNISGVGEMKLEKYGKAFSGAIVAYLVEQMKEGKKVKGGTQLYSYHLFAQGVSLEEIAAQRELTLETVYGHLATAYEKGLPVPLKKLISQEDFGHVKRAVKETGVIKPIKDLFDHLGGEVPYHIIRVGVALLDREF